MDAARPPMESVPEGPPRLWTGSAPEIRIDYEPIGRETLAAITDELIAEAKLIDMGATASTAEAERTAPPIGRDTLAALSEVLGGGETPTAASNEAPSFERSVPEASSTETAAGRRRRRTVGYEEQTGPLPSQAHDLAVEIFELATFVVRGANLAQLASQSGRRLFVAERLSNRLPVQSLSAVERVDIAPWTEKGTVIVRVWCRVSAN